MTVITAALCQKKVRGSPRGVRVDGIEETGWRSGGRHCGICTVGTDNSAAMTRMLHFN